MIIEIKLTHYCNLNCSYCVSMHSSDKTLCEKEQFDLEGFINFLDEFQCTGTHPRFKEIKFFIFGGEPSTSKDLIPLVNYLNKLVDSNNIIIQTNLTNLSTLKKINCLINISWHPEFISFKELINRLNKLPQERINEIAFMDVDDKYYKYYNILKKLYKVEFCPIIEDIVHYDGRWLKRLKELKNKDIFKVIQNDEHFHKFKSNKSNYDYWVNEEHSIGKKCFINYEVLFISNNKVYECFNDMFFNINGINLRDYEYIPKIKICPHQRCFFDMRYQEENYEKN